MKTRLTTSAAAALLACAGAATAAAADTNLEGRPATWRMQDYLNGTITLYYTGSSCPSGVLILPSSASSETQARLWSLLLTASATHKAVGIFYDPDTCAIRNFYSV